MKTLCEFLIWIITFAVHGHCPICWFTNLKEFLQNQIVWFASVGEKELLMLKAGIRKTGSTIQFEIQSDDRCDAVLPEIAEIWLWRMTRIAIVCSRFVVRSAECKKFPRNDPIQIAVFNALVIFIFVGIEIVKIEETFNMRLLQCRQTIVQIDGVTQRAIWRITKLYVCWTLIQQRKHFFGRLFQM